MRMVTSSKYESVAVMVMYPSARRIAIGAKQISSQESGARTFLLFE
jgi:hypothetical protein